MDTTNDSHYISVADTAKIIRSDLKAAFPGIVFSVRSHSYSMGASITVRWVDGPTTDQVESVTEYYRAKGPMDNSDYSPDVYKDIDGVRTHYGSNYVFTERTYSQAFGQAVADQVADSYGVAWVKVDERGFWGAALRVYLDNGQDLCTMIYRTISGIDARFYAIAEEVA